MIELVPQYFFLLNILGQRSFTVNQDRKHQNNARSEPTKHRRQVVSLSDPDQSLSENVIILVYQKLPLCWITNIIEATISFIDSKFLVFWIASLWHLGCHLFGILASSILQFWLTHIEATISLYQNKSLAFWITSL